MQTLTMTSLLHRIARRPEQVAWDDAVADLRDLAERWQERQKAREAARHARAIDRHCRRFRG